MKFKTVFIILLFISISLTTSGCSASKVESEIDQINEVGLKLMDQGKFLEAEMQFKKALHEAESLGPYNEDLAAVLVNLADAYEKQQKYKEEEPVLLRALEIWKKNTGEESAMVARIFDSLGVIHAAQGKNEEAEKELKLSISMFEKLKGKESEGLAISINNLGGFYANQGDYEQAEPLIKKAIKLQEKNLGVNHIDVASSLINLAGFELIKKNNAEAEALYKRALSIKEKFYGTSNPNLLPDLIRLAQFSYVTDKLDQSGQYYIRAYSIDKNSLGPNALFMLGEYYCSKKQYKDAEISINQSLPLLEKAVPEDHPKFVQALKKFAELSRKINRPELAKSLEDRINSLKKN